jgi:hypothetical protein
MTAYVNDTTAHVLELLDKIAGPLPQRIVNVDTGEKSDEYRISVSAAERDLIVTALRGNAALEAALSARTSELYPDLQAEIERLRAYRALPSATVIAKIIAAHVDEADGVNCDEAARAVLAALDADQPTLPMAPRFIAETEEEAAEASDPEGRNTGGKSYR